MENKRLKMKIKLIERGTYLILVNIGTDILEYSSLKSNSDFKKR